MFFSSCSLFDRSFELDDSPLSSWKSFNRAVGISATTFPFDSSLYSVRNFVTLSFSLSATNKLRLAISLISIFPLIRSIRATSVIGTKNSCIAIPSKILPFIASYLCNFIRSGLCTMPSCTVILCNKNRKKLSTRPIPPLPFLISLLHTYVYTYPSTQFQFTNLFILRANFS